MTSQRHDSEPPRTVADLMKRDVITASPDDGVRDLARLLHEHDVSGVVVVSDDGEVVGTVSVTDILWLSDRIGPLLAGTGEDARHTASDLGTVEDVMTADVFSLEPDASVYQLLDFFSRTGLHRAPIIEDGRLVGIVSASDLVALIANA